MNIAELGVEVTPKGVAKTTTELDKFSGAAKRAETANDNRAASDKRAAAAANVNAAANRALAASSGAAAFRQRQLAVQSIDVAQSLALGLPPLQVAVQQGGQLAGIYAGQGGLTGAFKEAGASMLRFAKGHPVLVGAITAISAVMTGLRSEINKGSDVTVGFGDTALAVFNVIARSVGSVLAPAYNAVAEVAAQVWNQIIAGAKTVGNAQIGIFVAAKDGIIAAWKTIPGAVGDLTFQAANATIKGVQFLINNVIGQINSLTALANKIPGVDIGAIGNVELPQLSNPFANAAGASSDAISAAVTGGFGQDFLGDFFTEVKTEAIKLAKEGLEPISGAAGRAGGALKNAADKGSDAWKNLRGVTSDTVSKIKQSANELGGSLGGIFRGLLDGTTTWRDAALSALQSVLQYFNQLSTSQGGGGLFGGGLLQGVLGGFLGIGFKNGGYTGNGGRNKEAGCGAWTRVCSTRKSN